MLATKGRKNGYTPESSFFILKCLLHRIRYTYFEFSCNRRG
jgi:hypothetical protein